MADPNGFDYFRAGQVIGYQGGTTSTTGFDYFRAGEVFPAGITVDAGEQEQTPARRRAGIMGYRR